VVNNIQAARAVWAQLLGVEEPPIVETESWESTRMMVKGKPSKGRARLTFFNLENVVLEPIEPISGPSTWQEFLETKKGGMHLGFDIEDLDDTLKDLKGMGIGPEQRGDYKGGCYVYSDSKGKLGVIIELLHSHR